METTEPVLREIKDLSKINNLCVETRITTNVKCKEGTVKEPFKHKPGQLGLYEFDFSGRDQKEPLQVKPKCETTKTGKTKADEFNQCM